MPALHHQADQMIHPFARAPPPCRRAGRLPAAAGGRCRIQTHQSPLFPARLQHQDELSTGKDSSTHSALFDLELSSRGAGNRATDYLARLNPSVHDESTHNGSTHASGDPSVRLPSGLLQRIIYLGRPVAEFELDVSAGQGARQARYSIKMQYHLPLAPAGL